MTLGWFRVKLGPFESDEEWERAIRSLAGVIQRLEQRNDLVRYYFLNHGAPAREIMMNFYGDPEKLIHEVEEEGWGHRILPNMPENFAPKDEAYRFNDDYMIGISLFELGSRLAIASRLARPLQETNEGITQSIFYALRHAFANGLLSSDEQFMAQLDPPLGQLARFFATRFRTPL